MANAPTESEMLSTDRLRLFPATTEMLAAELDGHQRLSSLIGVDIPDSWPPDEYDQNAIRWVIDRLDAATENRNWLLWYCVLVQPQGVNDILIGTIGFRGSPDKAGVVETGYGLAADFHKQGYATEAVNALADWAFETPELNSIVAQTLADHGGSIGVLDRTGFSFIREGMDDGLKTVVYERKRHGVNSDN